jgi:tRNA(fMet)-specific endonuclease VapC
MSPSNSEQRFLLDTNIVSDLVRHPHGRVAQRIAAVGEDRVCTSVIIAAELRYGAAKKGSARLSRQLDAVLGALDILPLEPPADAAYGALRAELEAKGRLIGPNDLLIAAHAQTLGCALVTDNESEFGRVPDLAVENWLRPERKD